MAIPVRARDLRTNIKEFGFEQGVVTTLELFMEEYSQDRQTMREMASILNQCADNVLKMMHVGEKMKAQIEEFGRNRDKEASE